MMEYKGYVGHVEFDAEANLFYGEVVGIRDVVTFQGRSVNELRKAFDESIDDYHAYCEKRGEEPDKPFSGKFLLRLDPEIHRQLSQTSLNAWVIEHLRGTLQKLEIGAPRATTRIRNGKGRQTDGRVRARQSKDEVRKARAGRKS